MKDFDPTKYSGGTQFVEWFGGWPAFHDAEVLEVVMNRANDSSHLKLHVWKDSKFVDEKGAFIKEKEAIVTILLSNVLRLELSGFNHQNVLWGIEFKVVEDGIAIELMECYGLAGTVVTAGLAISFEPIGS